MIRRALLVLLLFVAVLTTFATTASATIVVKLSLEELAQRSEVIAYGEVIKQESYWSEDGYAILTRVSLLVDDGVVGAEAGKTLEFVTLGGSIDGLAQAIAGEAAFRVGEHALVFLEARKPGGDLNVVGMAQGKFAVILLPDAGPTDPPMVAPNLGNLTLAAIQPETSDSNRSVVTALETPKEVEPRPLTEVIAQVRSARGIVAP